MTLGESHKVSWLDELDVSGIDVAGWDVAVVDEFAEPGCGFWVVLIVIVHGGLFDGDVGDHSLTLVSRADLEPAGI